MGCSGSQAKEPKETCTVEPTADADKTLLQWQKIPNGEKEEKLKARMALCAEVYNGKQIASPDWWSNKWSEDCSFVVGPVKLEKAAVVATHEAILKSFPDFQFNLIEPLAAQENGTITCVIEATGTHTGEPYAFMPDVEAVASQGIKVTNDPEKVTVFFNDEGLIVRQTINALPGGKGFSGPAGMYRQIGGKLEMRMLLPPPLSPRNVEETPQQPAENVEDSSTKQEAPADSDVVEVESKTMVCC